MEHEIANAAVTAKADSVEDFAGVNNAASSGPSASELSAAGLIRITWTFSTTDDNKDHDTSLSTSCDNRSVLLGAGDVGGGQEWGDWSNVNVGIPVANAATWESCAVGNIYIVEHPNGDDEWHLNVSLFLEFEFGGWRRINWNGINLAEDRPSFHGTWG